MRLLVVFWFLLALLVSACDDSVAGIEVGNPEVAFSTSFVLDYGEKNYSVLELSSVQNILILDDLPLFLKEVKVYASYYIYVKIDQLDGSLVWPTPEMNPDTSIRIDFRGENFNLAILDSSIVGDGILKEVELNISPADSITGTLMRQDSSIPFVYSLAGLDNFQLRFHYRQIQKNAANQWNLPIRFYVNEWIKNISFDEVVLNEAGEIRFDEINNPILWKELNERFLNQFSCLRWDEDSSLNVEGNFVSEALAYFDRVNYNWISNGDFSKGSTDWILVQQFGGVADTVFIRESSNTVLNVRIAKTGTKIHSVQLIHENVPVLKNRKYKLSFSLKASQSDSVMVRLGTYHPPYRSLGFEKSIKPSPAGIFYEFECIGFENNPFGRLEFNLGKASQEYWIEDIKWIQQD